MQELATQYQRFEVDFSVAIWQIEIPLRFSGRLRNEGESDRTK